MRNEYDRRILAASIRDAKCIEYALEQYGVNATINDKLTIVNRQFFAFAIDVHGGKRGRVQDVVSLQREIAIAISNGRDKRTSVRIQELPLMIEVENPWPQPLDHSESRLLVGAHRMLAGIEYDPYTGRNPLIFDFADAHHHILIGGATGAGKSILQNMMVLSLAASTSPADLRMVLIDLKGLALPKYAGLPHVAQVVTRIDAAEQMIAQVHAEVEWRKDNYTPTLPRLVLVIDELAELRNSKTAIDSLNSILALGRGLRVNCVLCTQDPTKETLGGISTRNIRVRISGSVADADASRYVTGRAGVNAHLLPLNRGSFIAVAGNEIKRFQAYYLQDEPAADKAEDIADYWTETLAGRTLPAALHVNPKSVVSHNRLGQKSVVKSVIATTATSYPPVITDFDDDFDDFGQESEPVAITGGVQFPIGSMRTLTDRERAEVRRMATQAEFQYAGKPSKTRLCIAVFGSKDEDRMKEIDRALSGESDTSKIIRLPQRAAGR